MTDNPDGVLTEIYDDPPYFNPDKVGFRLLRSFADRRWTAREPITTGRTIVFSDMEYYLPGATNYWWDTRRPPCLKQDKVIISSTSMMDHLWPCEVAFNSYHFIHTCMRNKDIVVEQRTSRPYFASILLGNYKPQRKIFFDMLVQHNQLEDNIINYFHNYRSSFIDSSDNIYDKGINNLVDSTMDYVDTTCPLSNDDDRGMYMKHAVSKHIEENSWISVFGEFLDSDHRVFFPTEKTAKAMISGKPFIVLGGRHFLKNLRKQGFKTFHPIIDERYDEIKDSTDRMKAAFTSFMRLKDEDQLTVRHKLMPALIYNEQCMRNKEWLARHARKLLEPLAEQCYNTL